MRKRLLTLCSSFCVMIANVQAQAPRLVEAMATLGQGVEQATPHASLNGTLAFSKAVPKRVQLRLVLLEPTLRENWLKTGKPAAKPATVTFEAPDTHQLRFAAAWPDKAPQRDGLVLGVEVWVGKRRLGRDARDLTVAWLQSRPRPDRSEP